MTQLTSFTLQSLSNIERKVSIDPRKVTAVRETVHGSVLIFYSPKDSFEVSDSHDEVVRQINEARA